MKTSFIFFCCITASIMTWQAQSAWYAVLAYTTLVILIKAIGRKLINKIDS